MKKRWKGYYPSKPEADSRLTKAKVEYKLVLKAIGVAQSTIEIAWTRAYELYGNLLSDEACQIKAQIDIAPWEDLKRAVQQEKRTTMWDSFLESILLHFSNC